MNQYEYLQAQLEDPNFNKNMVTHIELDKISVGAHQVNNEVRQSGLNPNNLKNLEVEIKEAGGNVVPVGVSPLPNGKFQLNDGAHRHEAMTRLNERHPNLGFDKIKATKENFPSRVDRKFSMLNSNSPEYSQAPATIDDIANTLHSIVTEDMVLGSDLSKVTTQQIQDLIKSRVTKSLHHQTIAAIVRRVYKRLGYPGAKYHVPTNDEELVAEFNRINPCGLSLNANFNNNGKYPWGTIHEDESGQKWAIYNGFQETWFKQNIVHYSLAKKAANPGAKVLVIGYNGTVTTNDSAECPVANFRMRVQKNVNQWNNHTLIRTALIDQLVWMPQVVRGTDKESFEYLYDSSGNKITA